MTVESGETFFDKVADPVSSGRRRWHRFARNRMAVVSLVIVVIAALTAILAPFIAPHDPNAISYGRALEGPSAEFWLGTDVLGRDLLSRLLSGLRTALFIAVSAELLALALALVVGVTAGYLGGRADQILMSATDVMYAFPTYLFAVILTAVLGRSPGAMIVAIAVGSWLTQARILRAQIIRLKSFEYIEAGRSMGAGPMTLIARYMLPNALGPVLVTTAFGIPAAMLAEAGLAILGLGVAPPEASLGSMITEGYKYVMVQPNLILWPFLLFAILLLAFTWIGDGIRDAYDTNEVGDVDGPAVH